MEGLPQLRVLQSHPDVSLQVGIGPGSHGGEGAAVVGFEVWKEKESDAR